MHIDKLRLKNFRCFDELRMTFHPELTVIVAENGQGKSSLLDAIRIGVWPFIKSFDLAKSSTFSEPSNSIAVDDVRILKLPESGMARQLPSEIELTGNWNEDGIKTWLRFREKEDRKTKTHENDTAKEMSLWASQEQQAARDSTAKARNLPMFGYYGTGRLWAQKKLRGPDKLSEAEEADLDIRTFAYRNCMDPASTYKHFKEWFIWAWESRVNMIFRSQVTEDEKRIADSRITVLQGVIDMFLRETTGWHTLEYSIEDQKSLILSHDVNGRMKVDYLSDGIRSMLAMVGDIAYRCIKLNPHLENKAALETRGIVLIDEIDMHLHPRWQQLILGQLQKAFPSIQFIVTTHSPQVLTTVKPDMIRALKTVDEQIVVQDNYAFSEGAEVQVVLEDILGVSARANELSIVKKLNRYLQCITEDHWDTEEAEQLRKDLNAWGQGHETALVKADMDIRLRQFRRAKGGT